MSLDPKLLKFSTASPNIISYSYTDIAEGTGIQKFYGFQYTDSVATKYGLGDSDTYGGDIDVSVATGASETYHKVIDYDFDLLAFNIPQTLNGTAEVVVASFVSGIVNQGVYKYIVARIRKYSGAIESEVANATSATNYVGGNLTGKYVQTIRIPIDREHYKRGDILRLTIEVWVKTADDTRGEGSVGIAFDPENRDGTYIIPSTDDPRTITKLIFKCPFRLDL